MKKIIGLLLLSFQTLSAQTAEQREDIKHAMDKDATTKTTILIQNYNNEKEKRINEYLEKNPTTPKSYLKNKNRYFLHDISKKGIPIYIKQRKKKN